VPVLGNLPALRRDLLGFFTQCAREYGDVVAWKLGGWPAVVVNNPIIAEQVLVKQSENFSKNKFFWRHFTAVFGQGLLTSEGAFWQRQRRLAAPAFTPRRVAGYGESMTAHTERLLEGWTPGERRNVHEDMMALALIIATDTFFRAEVKSDIAEVGRILNEFTAEAAVRRRRPFVIPDWVPLPGHVRYRRNIRIIEGIVYRIIRQRRHEDTDRGDLLSAMLQARDTDGLTMTERQLRDEVITMLLAGVETTALTLSWAFYLLGQHPAADEQLAAELREVLGGRAPTVEDLPRLRVTENVIRESLRLYPPVWNLARDAINNCELAGYSVSGGTMIFMSPWVLHRDGRQFEDPAAFRPERWEDDLAERLPRCAYMPFGAGPRICIGSKFAMQETVLLLATIAQRFKLELRNELPIKPLPSITLRPQGGVWVEPVPR
jgi:cytochrome P450